jgi:hypothetical protein
MTCPLIQQIDYRDPVEMFAYFAENTVKRKCCVKDRRAEERLQWMLNMINKPNARPTHKIATKMSYLCLEKRPEN